MGNQMNQDAQDEQLADNYFGQPVTFIWSGCPGVYAKQQLTGIILDVKTCKNGERALLVKADTLNLPKWVNINQVQFPNKKTAAFAAA